MFLESVYICEMFLMFFNKKKFTCRIWKFTSYKIPNKLIYRLANIANLPNRFSRDKFSKTA